MDRIPIVQLVFFNAPSLQNSNIVPATLFMGSHPTHPIEIFIITVTFKPDALIGAQMESTMNVEKLLKLRDGLDPLVHSSPESCCEQAWDSLSQCKQLNHSKGDFVLVVHSDFNTGKELCLRCHDPHHDTKAFSDQVFQVDDLRNSQLDEVYVSILKLFRDSSLDDIAIMSHFLRSETSTVVSRLLNLKETLDGLFFRVCWKGFQTSYCSLELVSHVAKDVLVLFYKLLQLKSIRAKFVATARVELSPWEWGVWHILHHDSWTRSNMWNITESLIQYLTKSRIDSHSFRNSRWMPQLLCGHWSVHVTSHFWSSC